MNIPGDYLGFAYHLPKPGERLSDQRAGDTVRASALLAALRRIGVPVDIHEVGGGKAGLFSHFICPYQMKAQK